MDALVDDVVAEILLRLPPKSVLRCRAVSKRWRRVTTCRTFVAAYSRRQRLELLVYPDGYHLSPDDHNILAGLDPLNSDYSACRRFLRLDGGRSLRLADSRDGLLLLAASDNGTFVICNPATRQTAVLPPLTPEPCAFAVPSGLYFHEPSGEHRLLCIGRLQLQRDDHHPPSSSSSAAAVSVTGPFHYFILSTGSAAVRRLGPARGLGVAPSACVAVGGVLYWSHHPESGDSVDLVAFDTVSEKFRLIPRPPPLTRRHYLRAFDMEGTLAVSAVAEGSLRMDVWALEAAGHPSSVAAWARRLRIDLPRQRWMRELEFQPTDQAVAVVEGGLLVVVGAGCLLLYDVKEKRTVSRVYYGAEIGNVSRCLYRASLVPLPASPPCPGGGTAEAASSSLQVHYYRPEDPSCLNGRSRDTWFVPDLEYAWYLRYEDTRSLCPDTFVRDSHSIL